MNALLHCGCRAESLRLAAQVGCTAVVAVLKAGELFVANAGDSRAVLGRGGEAVPLSADHKPASASEKERITNAGGFVSEVLPPLLKKARHIAPAHYVSCRRLLQLQVS